MSVKVILNEINCLRQTALSNMRGLHPTCWRPEKNKRQCKGETLLLPIFKLGHQSLNWLGLTRSALPLLRFSYCLLPSPFWFLNFTMYIFLLCVSLTNYCSCPYFYYFFSLHTRCMNDLLTTIETFEYYEFNWWDLYFYMFSSY